MISVGPPPGTPIMLPQNNNNQPRGNPAYIHPKKINIVQQERVLSAQESQYRQAPLPQQQYQPAQQVNSPRNYNPQLSPRAYVNPPSTYQGNQPYISSNQPYVLSNQPQRAQNTGNVPSQVFSNYPYQSGQNSYMK